PHLVMKLEPGTKIGPYQILGELGKGGMATVYRAYQPSLEREVALKVLPEFLIEQPGFKARFHREAGAVARLQHPNILSVFDQGEQGRRDLHRERVRRRRDARGTHGRADPARLLCAHTAADRRRARL